MVFNCDEVILDALKDLDGKVDEIHCYDGRWAYMHYTNEPHSTDKTKTIIEEFAKTSKSKIKYEKLPSSMWESDARTMSLKDVEIGDWVMVLDSDERLIEWNENIRIELEKSNKPCYTVNWEYKTSFKVCRFFKKVEGMKYVLTDRVYAPPHGVYNEYLRNNPVYIGITICHNRTKRKIPRASEFTQRPHP